MDERVGNNFGDQQPKRHCFIDAQPNIIHVKVQLSVAYTFSIGNKQMARELSQVLSQVELRQVPGVAQDLVNEGDGFDTALTILEGMQSALIFDPSRLYAEQARNDL